MHLRRKWLGTRGQKVIGTVYQAAGFVTGDKKRAFALHVALLLLKLEQRKRRVRRIRAQTHLAAHRKAEQFFNVIILVRGIKLQGANHVSARTVMLIVFEDGPQLAF